MAPELKMESGFIVDCFDLDKFVAIHLEGFGRTWRALDTGHDGYHNGSFVSADVEYGAEIEDDIDQDFTRWLTGGMFYQEEDGDDAYSYLTPGIQHILQWLCNLGEIPTGKYVVELWW